MCDTALVSAARIPDSDTAICTKCTAEKPLTAEFFMRRAGRPWPWYQPCRDCRYASSDRWAKANPERVRANDRKRYKPRTPRTIMDRLLAKIEVDEKTGCWLWQGKRNSAGYGVIWSGGSLKEGRELRVHRVSYEHFVEPIPAGLTLDHVRARGCRYRHCANPAHLEPVTHRENIRRGVGEHSASKTHCKRNHEFTSETTYITKAGYRNCLTCAKLRERVIRSLRKQGLPVSGVSKLY